MKKYIPKMDPNTGQFAVKEFDVEEVIVSQHKSFLRTCVVSVDGMSFDPDEFYKRWPDAAEDLYEKATSLAAETEVAAVESEGKLPATSGGKSIGKEEKTSMTDLQKQAS